MVHIWGTYPDVKVEADSTNLSKESFSVLVVRPESAVSRVKVVANDDEGKNFIDNLNLFDTLKISLRYGSDSWTQVFEGIIEDATPQLSEQGQNVGALAYGYGRAIRNTHVDTSFGAESQNPSLDTPEEIWDDLVDNYINKSFGGAATGYAITKAQIEAIATPTIQYVGGTYKSCLDILDQVCNIVQATRGANAGPHWMVDTSKNLRIKYITTVQAGWPVWWRTDQAGSTLTEGLDLLEYHLTKKGEGFANKIVLCSDLRKPGYDYWTENQSGLWGTSNCTLSDDAGTKVVGGHSLKAENADFINPPYAWYPSGANWNLDTSKLGSLETIPTISLYVATDDSNYDPQLLLFTDWTGAGDGADNYFWTNVMNLTTNNTFRHYAFPIGSNYEHSNVAGTDFLWSTVGAPDWTEIDGMGLRWPISIANKDYWVDDLHLTGKVIREAYNSTSIGNDDEVQKIIYSNRSLDDSMIASDDTGTAGALAYTELLWRQKKPIVGTVKIPLIVDILPGQKVHIHADKQAYGSLPGTYRIDSDFRVKEITHTISQAEGFITTLALTDDVINFSAKGPTDVRSIFAKAAFADPEAKDLQSSDVDLLISRLSKDYP